jgi:hypothetical protein
MRSTTAGMSVSVRVPTRYLQRWNQCRRPLIQNQFVRVSSCINHSISSISLIFPYRYFSVKSASTVNNKEGDPNKIAFYFDDVTKRFQNGRALFSNVKLSFYHGAKIGILGGNEQTNTYHGIGSNNDENKYSNESNTFGYIIYDTQCKRGKAGERSTTKVLTQGVTKQMLI